MKRICDISDIPEKEVEAIRKLLSANKVRYHETPGARRGDSKYLLGGTLAIFSTPAALWAPDDDYHRAQYLVAEFHRTRGKKSTYKRRPRASVKAIKIGVFLLALLMSCIIAYIVLYGRT